MVSTTSFVNVIVCGQELVLPAAGFGRGKVHSTSIPFFVGNRHKYKCLF